MNANLQAILDAHDADNLSQLAHYVYKYTDCGAHLSALVDGAWVHDRLDKVDPERVTALAVGSIVEGVEQTTITHEIAFEHATPEQSAADYSAALDATEKEADEIWRNTHGCPKCAEHAGFASEWGVIEGDDGMTPIWDECPECGGHGSVI